MYIIRTYFHMKLESDHVATSCCLAQTSGTDPSTALQHRRFSSRDHNPIPRRLPGNDRMQIECTVKEVS